MQPDSEPNLPPDLQSYHVVWRSPGRHSGDSMPCGGHDVGLNVWVEGNDLLFYVDRTGNFDENNQQLKTGRARIRITPSPFGADQPFRQELVLTDGYVAILAGSPEVRIVIWVDVFTGRINAEIEAAKPVHIQAHWEIWRFEKRQIPPGWRHPCLSLIGYQGSVFTYPDTVTFEGDSVVFYHRNRSDDLVRDKLIQQQKLHAVADRIPDTQKDRTFGGMLRAAGMRPAGTHRDSYLGIDFEAHCLETASPVCKQHIEWVLHTGQESTLGKWRRALDEKAAGPSRPHAESIDWWHSFWDRSHICIRPGGEAHDPACQVGRNYQLFRYMLGCNAFGEYPSKFNGSLFTMDPRFAESDRLQPFDSPTTFRDHTPDFRKWGGRQFHITKPAACLLAPFEKRRLRFDAAPVRLL